MLGVFRLSGKPRGTGRAKPFRAEGQSPSCTEEEDKNVLHLVVRLLLFPVVFPQPGEADYQANHNQ